MTVRIVVGAPFFSFPPLQPQASPFRPLRCNSTPNSFTHSTLHFHQNLASLLFKPTKNTPKSKKLSSSLNPPNNPTTTPPHFLFNNQDFDIFAVSILKKEIMLEFRDSIFVFTPDFSVLLRAFAGRNKPPNKPFKIPRDSLKGI